MGIGSFIFGKNYDAGVAAGYNKYAAGYESTVKNSRRYRLGALVGEKGVGGTAVEAFKAPFKWTGGKVKKVGIIGGVVAGAAAFGIWANNKRSEARAASRAENMPDPDLSADIPQVMGADSTPTLMGEQLVKGQFAEREDMKRKGGMPRSVAQPVPGIAEGQEVQELGGRA